MMSKPKVLKKCAYDILLILLHHKMYPSLKAKTKLISHYTIREKILTVLMIQDIMWLVIVFSYWHPINKVFKSGSCSTLTTRKMLPKPILFING